MLELLRRGLRVVNVDESWLNESRFIRRMWCPPDGAGTVTGKMLQPRLSLIAALDTDGRLYFSLTHANTDSDVMLAFMQHLIRQLYQESPDWREGTVFLFDGARYHTSEEMREYFRKMEVRVIYSAPYSYSAAPIELVFGALKRGELNKKREPTGKK
jgi:transposase